MMKSNTEYIHEYLYVRLLVDSTAVFLGSGFQQGFQCPFQMAA